MMMTDILVTWISMITVVFEHHSSITIFCLNLFSSGLFQFLVCLFFSQVFFLVCLDSLFCVLWKLRIVIPPAPLITRFIFCLNTFHFFFFFSQSFNSSNLQLFCFFFFLVFYVFKVFVFYSILPFLSSLFNPTRCFLSQLFSKIFNFPPAFSCPIDLPLSISICPIVFHKVA